MACAPERIADDKEGDVGLVGARQYRVALRLDHVSVGYDKRSAIEGFLGGVSSVLAMRASD